MALRRENEPGFDGCRAGTASARVKGYVIGEGTSEIQRNIIARRLGFKP